MLEKFRGLECPDCGEKIGEEDDVCPHCGVNLNAPIGHAEKSLEGQTDSKDLINARRYFDRVQKALDKGDQLEQALTDSQIAIQYNPNSAEAHNQRGLLLDLLERPQEAIQEYREALRLDPNFEEARSNLADLQKDVREAQFQTVGLDTSDPTDDSRKNLGSNIIVFMTILLALAVFVATMYGK